MKLISKQLAWMQCTLAAGKCRHCAKPRGADGTKTFCRKCADNFNEYHKRWRDRKAAE